MIPYEKSWKEKKLTLLKDKNDVNSSVLNTTGLNWQGNSTNDLGLRMVNALPFIHQLDRVVQTRFFACQHLVGSIKHAWKIIVIYLTVTAFLVKHRSFNIMISNWFFVYNNCNIALIYLVHEYKNVFYVEDHSSLTLHFCQFDIFACGFLECFQFWGPLLLGFWAVETSATPSILSGWLNYKQFNLVLSTELIT